MTYGHSNYTNNLYSIESGVFYQKNLTRKLNLDVCAFGSFNKYPYYINNSIDSTNSTPNWGLPLYHKNKNYILPVILMNINVQPIKYLTLSVGYNKNFIGNGYRSLLISDNSPPYPYLKGIINFWRIEYHIIWAYLKDIISSNSNDISFTDKYGVFHYLDVNITKRLSMGFFESVIWWGKDNTTNRGIELYYLNPVIFFRPVEYSLHSPDNANLGGNMSIRLWNKTFIYGQIFIDDLMVKELLKNSGWWGNKYGLQIGFKTHNLLNINNLFFQNEFNLVRPFTYSHSSVNLNYGTLHTPLAHPLGANFREYISIVRYSYKNWFVFSKTIFYTTGKDTSNLNFGQDIYKSYLLRVTKNNKVEFLQGNKLSPFYAELTINKKIIQKWNLYFFVSIKKYLSDIKSKEINETIFSVGINTQLLNNERDFW